MLLPPCRAPTGNLSFSPRKDGWPTHKWWLCRRLLPAPLCRTLMGWLLLWMAAAVEGSSHAKCTGSRRHLSLMSTCCQCLAWLLPWRMVQLCKVLTGWLLFSPRWKWWPACEWPTLRTPPASHKLANTYWAVDMMSFSYCVNMYFYWLIFYSYIDLYSSRRRKKNERGGTTLKGKFGLFDFYPTFCNIKHTQKKPYVFVCLFNTPSFCPLCGLQGGSQHNHITQSKYNKYQYKN